MESSVPFLISGLAIEQFEPLFRLTDAELVSAGAMRCIADTRPGYPCRVSLEEATIGEQVLLLHYRHHDVPGPYRAAGPVYVRENARQTKHSIGEVPEVVSSRLISVRAYDDEGLMLASNVLEGKNIEHQIATFFEEEKVAYLHVHNAKPGCYSCRVDRALSVRR